MVRKRPCRICGEFFHPDPRVGKVQRVCSKEACQRERHRRACSAWRRKNPDYDQDRRLRARLQVIDEKAAVKRFESERLRSLSWDVARDAIGLKPCVIIDETSKVLFRSPRDAIQRQPAENTGKSARFPP
jgi:hypothetical protein